MAKVIQHPPLPQGWRLARFDEVLKRVERKIILNDAHCYSCVGVRWYGLGAFVREQLWGMDIARKQQWIVKKGDVVYNKLFAWKGAFAVAGDSVDGCIVSDKFPTYEVDATTLEPLFLKCYFRSAHLWQQAKDLSRGAAAISKLTLNPPQLWDLTIPLPPLEEQRRIVARIDELDTRINRARALREEALKSGEALIVAHISATIGERSTIGHLGDVLTGPPRNGWSARCGNTEGGVAVLSLGAVTGFEYRSTEAKRTMEPTRPDAHYWLRAGDLLITRSNTPELVGHAAIYDGKPNPCIYPDLMMRLPIDESKADKRFVHRWLMSTVVRDFVRSKAKGTSPTMKKVSQGIVMAIPFPSQLSLEEQGRLCRQWETVITAVRSLKGLQRGTASEMDALMPSILSKAFAGEL